MKILIANNSLDQPGGSETYAYALAMELLRRGNDVYAFGKRIGPVGYALREAGIPASSSEYREYFDLVLASHTSVMSCRFRSPKIVQTVHGCIHPLERPSNRATHHVAISKEVQDSLRAAAVDSHLIYNGVDCNRFSPVSPFKETPETALILSRHSGFRNRIKNLLATRGIRSVVRDKISNPNYSLEKDIREADIVFSLGRGAYEAMACAKPVFCIDYRPYMKSKTPLAEGMLRADNIEQAMSCNCSGRASRLNLSDKEILEEIDEHYSAETAAFSRDYALSNLNISKTVDKYLDL